MITREAAGTIYHARRAGDRRGFHQGLHLPVDGAVHPGDVSGAGQRRTWTRAPRAAWCRSCCAFPASWKRCCRNDAVYEELARKLFRATDFLFLGRGIHFPIALEGALKLKEISYIHAEGYPAGEMKHGPNALIDEKLPVVVLATRDPSSEESRVLYEKTLSNIQEVKAREGIVVAVATEGDEDGPQDGRPRHRDSAEPGTADARSWRSCRCNCWRITSPCAAAATWISRATWPRA